MEEGTITEYFYPLKTALIHLPKYMINDKIAEKVKNGAVLPHTEDSDLRKKNHLSLLNDEDGKALAIYIHHPTKDK